MEQYISKSALVAEIERRIDLYDPIVGYEEGRKDEVKSILSFIDTLEVKEEQEEPASIWHNASEMPQEGSLILREIGISQKGYGVIRYSKEIPNFPKHCEDIPMQRWAYINDLLKLSKVERTVKDWKEIPVSEDLEKAAKEWNAKALDTPFYMTLDNKGNPNGVRQDYTTHAESFKAGAEWQKQKDSMPVSDDLEEAAKHYLYSNILYNDVYVGNPTDKDCIEMFKAGAEWGRNQAMAEIQTQSMAFVHGCPEENTSNELKAAADNALESIVNQYDIISVGSCLEMFRLGAKWQKEKEYTCYEEAFEDGAKWKKEKTIDKACKWIEEKAAKYLVDKFVDSTRVVGIDTSITEDFRKDMED